MTNADVPERPASPRWNLLARYPLTAFFVMAFAFSWIAWSPWFLSKDGAGLLPYSSPLINGLVLPIGILLGPSLSAFIVTGATEGRAGIRRLLRRIVFWRVGLRWYMFALVGVPVVMALGTVIVPGGITSLLALGFRYVPTYLVWFLIIGIIGGPLLEEPGWRGFALPRLQPRYGPLVGTLILGLLWALWHLPEFLVPAYRRSARATFPAPFWGKIIGWQRLSRYRQVRPHSDRLRHRHHVGFQQHERQRAYGHLGARLHRHI